MISLYKLQRLFRDIELALIATDGEITPDIEKMFDDIKAERDEKLTAIAALMKNADAECDVLKREENRLKELRQRAEKRVAKLGELVERLVPYNEDWTDGLHKISYRESKAVEILDFTHVPAEFIRVKTSEEVDKSKATAWFKAADTPADAEIPGLQFVTRYNLQVK